MLTQTLARELEKRGFELLSDQFFDTITVKVKDITLYKEKAESKLINLRYLDKQHIGISLDEITTIEDCHDIISCFEKETKPVSFNVPANETLLNIPDSLMRKSGFL